MIKPFKITVILVLSLSAVSSAFAGNQCVTISGNTGQLMPADCTSVWNTLKVSGKFQDIFTPTAINLHPFLCFVSNGNIPGIIETSKGSYPVNVSSTSAWTKEFAPGIFYPITQGQDNLGSVISQWIVKDAKNKVLGNIYARDAVDTSTSTEMDVIISGTAKYSDAKGAVKIESYPEIVDGQPTGIINITKVQGKFCYSE